MRSSVLHVIASGSTGGGTTHLRLLEPALSRHGIRSRICTTGDTPLRIPLVRAHDVVHAHGLRAALQALGPCMVTGSPLVYTVHGWSLHPGRAPWERPASWLLERLVTRVARQVICVCGADLKMGNRLGLLATKRVQVVPNAVEVPASHVRRRERARRLRLGFAGRLTWQKGLDTLLEALASLREDPGWEAWLIGDGPLREELEGLATALGLEDRVTWFGERDDAPDLLGATDIVVMPSRWEGLPYVALEAMARSRPVLGSQVNGLGDLIANSGGGMLIPPDDALGLARAITTCLRDPGALEDLGRRGRRHVARHHTLEAWARRMVKVYGEVLDR